VSDQLGHADPAFTLRVYAHAMRDEESDLSFAEFGGTKRLYPVLGISGDESESSNPLKTMARREGFEPPTLRFEGLGRNENFILKSNGYEFRGDGENGDARQ
jgi:hypothetical protein